MATKIDQPRTITIPEAAFDDVMNLVASLPFNHSVTLPDGRRLVAGQIVNLLLDLARASTE